MSAATVNGSDAQHVLVQVPGWGCWWSDVILQDPLELDPGDSCTIDLPGATCTGTVVSGGVREGRAAYHIVGGAGNWGAPVEALAYYQPAGVSVDRVIRDVAELVGETVDDLPGGALGYEWSRLPGEASLVLNQLAPQSWRVGLDGVTRFGVRESADYVQDYTVMDESDRALGVYALAVETVENLVPGCVLSEGTIVDVEYECGDKLIARVNVSGHLSDRAESYRRIVQACDPMAKYRGLYEYRVVSQNGYRLNLQNVKRSNGMPDLRSVAVRTAPGVRASFRLGSRVVVGYVGTTPYVIAGSEMSATDWEPTSIELCGDDDAIALASKVDALLQRFYDDYSSAPVNAYGAVIQASLLALLAAPPAWPWTCASTKVKAK